MGGKNRVHAHGLVLKEPISAFGFGAAAAGLRNIGRRLRVEIARHGKKALSMATISQSHFPELLLRPILWRLGRLSAPCGRKPRRARFLAKPLAAIRVQRIKINIFDRLARSVISVLATAATGAAHMEPVGGTVGSCGKTFRFNVGLQKQWSITIRLLPVLCQALLRHGQNLRGKISHLHLARDDKPRVCHDISQVGLTRRMAPTDPAIAGPQIQSGGAEAQRSHIPMLADNQVAQLRSAQRSIPKIVMRLYQLLPLQITLAIFRVDHNQFQLAQLVDRTLKLRRHVQVGGGKARSAKPHGTARRRQIDHSTALQAYQRHPAVHRFALAALCAPIEPIADAARQICPRPFGMIAHRRIDALEDRVRKNSTAHHHAGVHRPTACHKIVSVSSGGAYVR